MTGYKMNFATKTLTITKAFAAMAMKENTAEANLMKHMKELVPDLKVSYKTHYCRTPHPYKGLTSHKIERYISLFENASELMETYEVIRSIAETQPNPHNFVCKWFLTQFPDYREIPKIREGKIIATTAITISEIKDEMNYNLVA